MTPPAVPDAEHADHAEYWERRRRESVTLDTATVGAVKWASGILAIIICSSLLGGAGALVSLSRDVSVALQQIDDLRKWREQMDVRVTTGGFSARDGAALREALAASDLASRDRDTAVAKQIETLTGVIERLASRMDIHVYSDGHAVALQRIADSIRRIEALEKHLGKKP